MGEVLVVLLYVIPLGVGAYLAFALVNSMVRISRALESTSRSLEDIASTYTSRSVE
jgi:hypothetical protein